MNSNGHPMWDIQLVSSWLPRKLYFTATGTTTSQLRDQLEQETHKSCTVINGWYFGYAASGDFQPAWSINIVVSDWNIKDSVRSIIISSDIDTTKDQNLSTIVRSKSYNPSVWSLSSKQDSIEDSEYDYSFYAGPIVIRQWEIVPHEINQSTHGQWKYYRTFIIVWKNWECLSYVWNSMCVWGSMMGIATKPITLYELWKYLKSNISNINFVVNLDWWPSTSISSTEHSFNEHQKLPRFFYSCN